VDPANRAPVRIPAAVQVHRGARISFTGVTVRHTGTSGIDLADQTQDSSVTGSVVDDTAGIGEVDDYYQTQLALMTSGNTVSGSTVRRPGQQYEDAVGNLGRPQPRHHPVAQRHRLHALLRHLDRLGLGLGVRLHPAGEAGSVHLPPWFDLHRRQPRRRQPCAQRDGRAVRRRPGLHPRRPGIAFGVHRNVLAECINGCNMIYHDKGSSQWNTHDNVVRFSNGSLWLNCWTPSIHDNNVHDNYTDTAAYNNNGTNNTFQQPLWSPTASGRRRHRRSRTRPGRAHGPARYSTTTI
jgi:hypothetical protein